MFYDILFLVCVVIGLGYLYIRRRFSYWKRLNVPHVEPTFPYGNLGEMGRTLQAAHVFQKYYNKLKSSSFPFGGFYFYTNPTVLATDLDFLKNVLIKDFNHFVNRGLYHNEKDDPLSGHLISVDGDKWKRLRSELSPKFTSVKMKIMFPIVLNVADQLTKTINSLVNGDTSGDFEIKEILSRFTTDVIGTCVFGIECNSLKDENSDFRHYGRKIFEQPRNSVPKLWFMRNFPSLARKLKMKVMRDDVSEFFISSLKETIKYREENNVKRNDFLNMMMDLMKHGRLDDDEATANEPLSFHEVAANCFAFFFAGFEPSASTMMFTLFELAVNPEIQERARQEVNHVLKKHGSFTYEAMTELHYLDRCVQESLRKYPPTPTLLRRCSEEYLVPNTNVTLSKGTVVLIPAYSIHHDPEIYPNPDEFDPNRFLPEEVQKRHSLSHIPFGHGQRNCIGIRFGLMQTKVGLATILKHFELSLCSKSVNPLVFNPKPLLLAPAGGVWLNFKSIDG